MISLILDFFIDLFLLLFPLSFVSRRMQLKPKSFSDLKPALKQLGFRRISFKKFVKQTLLLVVALVLVGVALSYILSLAQANDLANVTKGIETIMKISPLLLLYYLLVRVFTEEVFFRGFLVNKIGVLPSTVLFALVHALYNSYAEVLGAFVLGLILAYGFKKKQCLFPIIVAHMLYNAFALLFILRVV